jgi:hypothetical protein
VDLPPGKTRYSFEAYITLKFVVGSFGLYFVLLTKAAFWICCVRSASNVAKNYRTASIVEWREREGVGDRLSAALLEILDFWITRLSHGFFLQVSLAPTDLICGLSIVIQGAIFGFQATFTKVPMSSFLCLFAVL